MFPTTTRPPFQAMPSAATFEIQLLVPQATRALALALDADSIPVRRTWASGASGESNNRTRSRQPAALIGLIRPIGLGG